MDLPFFKKNNPTPPRKYLFALEISPNIVKSAVWSVVNDKTQVLAVGHAVDWDNQSVDSLITACDQTLSDAGTHLDPTGKINIEEVILGLPPDWVDKDKIHLSKLGMLKEMGHKLDLKPVGFVVTPEAVVKYLQFSENVPPTAILLGFWPQVLEVTLVRLGRIDGTELVRRSSHVAADVVEGLSRFPNADVMPSRMLLYDSGIDLEDTKQQLLQHPWQAPQKKLSFLHFPKVEVLASDFTVRAIALSGGSEVAKAIGLITPEAVETTLSPASELAEEGMGFVSNVDIRSLPPQPVEEVEPTAMSTPTPVTIAKPKFKFSIPQFPKFSLPSLRLPKLRMSLAAAVVVAIAVLTALGIGYWYLPKANVTVLVKPQNFQTQFELTADTRLDTVSVDEKAVPAQALSVQLDDKKTISTTGSITVGDKATGSVTISNALDSAKSFAAGTVITSPSGLKYVLDESVNIASASGSAGNLTPGKATVKVTAGSIGSDSNLSAGTVFRVGNLAITQVDAKNDSAFSGGSSRQAKAVVKADIEQLRSELVNNLKDQARQKLLGQITDQQTVIDESITVETVSEEFDHKVGEEADQITLSLSVKATGLVLAKSDLQAVIDAQIKPQVPTGYTNISDQNQTLAVKSTDNDKAVFNVTVTALLLPQFDQEAALLAIRGKSPQTAKEYLQSLPSVAQIELEITPRLPLVLTTLPRVVKNISISVKPFK